MRTADRASSIRATADRSNGRGARPPSRRMAHAEATAERASSVARRSMERELERAGRSVATSVPTRSDDGRRPVESIVASAATRSARRSSLPPRSPAGARNRVLATRTTVALSRRSVPAIGPAMPCARLDRLAARSGPRSRPRPAPRAAHVRSIAAFHRAIAGARSGDCASAPGSWPRRRRAYLGP